MDNYFDPIKGQNQALQNLNKLYDTKRIPHALLFSGPKGVGKFFTAIQFTKLLNQTSVNPSLEKKISSLNEPFVKYVFPLPRGKGEANEDSATSKLTEKQIEELQKELQNKRTNPFHKITLEKANIIKISSIREIRKFLGLNYSDIPYRLILIEDAHLMNSEAQNALLKNLEEPPEGVIFILTTSKPDLLLTTIRSRCWTVNFNHLSNEEVKNYLQRYFSIENDQAELASTFSGGSVEEALNLIQNDFEELLETTIQILRFSLGGWLNSAYLELKNVLNDRSKETFKLVLKLILVWLNDVAKNKIHYDNYYFKNHEDTLVKFNKNFADADLEKTYNSIDNLMKSMDNNVLLNVIALNVILQLNSIAHR